MGSFAPERDAFIRSAAGPGSGPGPCNRQLFGQRARSKRKEPKDFVCFCQGISRQEIVECIDQGASSLEDLQEQIGATVGPCGGSCTPNVVKLLRDTLARNSGKPLPEGGEMLEGENPCCLDAAPGSSLPVPGPVPSPARPSGAPDPAAADRTVEAAAEGHGAPEPAAPEPAALEPAAPPEPATDDDPGASC